jgi:hypothetical protein
MISKMEAERHEKSNHPGAGNPHGIIDKIRFPQQSDGKMRVTSIKLAREDFKLLTPTKFIGTARLNELPVYDSITGST